MHFYISELFSAGSVKLGEIMRTLMIGAVCITAIVECGTVAMIAIAILAGLKITFDAA